MCLCLFFFVFVVVNWICFFSFSLVSCFVSFMCFVCICLLCCAVLCCAACFVCAVLCFWCCLSLPLFVRLISSVRLLLSYNAQNGKLLRTFLSGVSYLPVRIYAKRQRDTVADGVSAFADAWLAGDGVPRGAQQRHRASSGSLLPRLVWEMQSGGSLLPLPTHDRGEAKGSFPSRRKKYCHEIVTENKKQKKTRLSRGSRFVLFLSRTIEKKKFKREKNHATILLQ